MVLMGTVAFSEQCHSIMKVRGVAGGVRALRKKLTRNLKLDVTLQARHVTSLLVFHAIASQNWQARFQELRELY
jgi:hypothetical protein